MLPYHIFKIGKSRKKVCLSVYHGHQASRYLSGVSGGVIASSVAQAGGVRAAAAMPSQKPGFCLFSPLKGGCVNRIHVAIQV